MISAVYRWAMLYSKDAAIYKWCISACKFCISKILKIDSLSVAIPWVVIESNLTCVGFEKIHTSEMALCLYPGQVAFSDNACLWIFFHHKLPFFLSCCCVDFVIGGVLQSFFACAHIHTDDMGHHCDQVRWRFLQFRLLAKCQIGVTFIECQPLRLRITTNFESGICKGVSFQIGRSMMILSGTKVQFGMCILLSQREICFNDHIFRIL